MESSGQSWQDHLLEFLKVEIHKETKIMNLQHKSGISC